MGDRTNCLPWDKMFGLTPLGYFTESLQEDTASNAIPSFYLVNQQRTCKPHGIAEITASKS